VVLARSCCLPKGNGGGNSVLETLQPNQQILKRKKKNHITNALCS